MVRINKKPYIITIIILIVIILGLGGYIAYDYLYKDNDDIKVVTMVDDVNINLNAFYQISETLSRFDNAFNKTGTNYFGYIYNEKKLEAKKFNQKAAMYAALSKELTPSNTNQNIIGNKVKGNFESMFGDALKYDANSIELSNQTKINYDTNTDLYSYIIPLSTNLYSFEYIASNVKTVLEEDKVIITRKIFYVEYNGNGNDATKAIIYQNANKQQKLGEVSLKNGQANVKEVMGKYGSKLNTYDYTFIKNADEDYTFYMIERTK